MAEFLTFGGISHFSLIAEFFIFAEFLTFGGISHFSLIADFFIFRGISHFWRNFSLLAEFLIFQKTRQMKIEINI
jgi:hypothetical protein